MEKLFVRITKPISGWYQRAKKGDIVEIKHKDNKAYPLATSPHNDQLFTNLPNLEGNRGMHLFVNGVSRGTGGDYRGCWIHKDHCEDYVFATNNEEALSLLMEEE